MCAPWWTVIQSRDSLKVIYSNTRWCCWAKIIQHIIFLILYIDGDSHHTFSLIQYILLLIFILGSFYQSFLLYPSHTRVLIFSIYIFLPHVALCPPINEKHMNEDWIYIKEVSMSMSIGCHIYNSIKMKTSISYTSELPY